ncbi:MAG TPA: phosphoglycerate kinase [Patescibacteria group bacterium]|nr:phosphoglycerate kinase [Patescibacteria group bacterium]
MTISNIEDHEIKNKTVLLRADFNVSLAGNKITDDTRITQVLPTINLLLQNNNKIIIISHLGRPEGRDEKFSLSPVRARLQKYLPGFQVKLVDDFLSEKGKEMLAKQTHNQILLLENIRFYEGEQKNDASFAKQLALLGDVYVNDGFGVSHRNDASVVGIPKYLPHFAGLLMKKEIQAISSVLENPQKPFVAIIGGAKTETKIPLLYKLVEIADSVLLGGIIANTFLHHNGVSLGKSLYDKGLEKEVSHIISHAKTHHTRLFLPLDARCATSLTDTQTVLSSINSIDSKQTMFDIGPETEAVWGSSIAQAATIVWNGPVGYIENPAFSQGTEFLYYSIAQNDKAYSVVGGGDTLAALSHEEHLGKISHISTGGGAMLEFIENGTLPGIEALR